MSQIVQIKVLKVTDLSVARKVAKDLGWTESVNKKIYGVGQLSGKVADYSFDIRNGRNLGLVKDEKGHYDLYVDNDVKKIVNEQFIFNYSKEFVKKEIALKGLSFTEEENEKELVITYNC